MNSYEYYREALAGIPKPCAFLDVDLLNQNIKEIIKSSNQKQIRIATKSIRSVEVLQKISTSSSYFSGYMCYTAEEALYLHSLGFNDLLIAYPISDETYLKKIAARMKDNAFIIVMVDSIEHINRLEKIAAEEKSTFFVCVDIDLSSQLFGIHFGVHRSPIKTIHQAISIVKRVYESAYLKLDGIMGYEAQIAGLADNNPHKRAKSQFIRFLKKKSLAELNTKRKAIVEKIAALGVKLRFVNGGGTGSLQLTALEDDITEVTVGSGFYFPHLFDHYQDFQYMPAVGYAIEITRTPTKHIYTCHGGGYTASGAIDNDKQPQVYLPAGAKLTTTEGAGEVQTPIYYAGDISLKLGDPIIMRHSKAGELCEHFQYLYLIQQGKVIGKYTTYRGDGQCFL